MNRQKIYVIFGIMLVVLVVSFASSYAYWTITKTQNESNLVTTECLNITFADASKGISLDKTWPISDAVGMKLEGYTFTVKNNCNKPIDYRIDLDRLNELTGQTSLNNEFVRTLLDDETPKLYSELQSGETLESGVTEKKILSYETVLAGRTNTHTIKLWMYETATITEQGKNFSAKIRVVTGQKI